MRNGARFKHDNRLGKTPSHALFDLVRLNRKESREYSPSLPHNESLACDLHLPVFDKSLIEPWPMKLSWENAIRSFTATCEHCLRHFDSLPLASKSQPSSADQFAEFPFFGRRSIAVLGSSAQFRYSIACISQTGWRSSDENIETKEWRFPNRRNNAFGKRLPSALGVGRWALGVCF
jgi:hypothetical protein